VDESSGRETETERPLETAGAKDIGANRNDKAVIPQSFEFLGSSYQRALAKNISRLLAVIVQKYDLLEPPRATGDI
jgi:hypothetical protein